MSEPAWITRWQAREALKNGQPEEAHRLFDSLVAAGNRRAWALRGDVVRGYVERAERALRSDDAEAAWVDLLKAETLSATDPGASRLRDTLTRLGLAEARALLENGKPLLAIEALVRLKERPARSPEIAPLEETAQDWILAQETADRGDFEAARQTLERVRRRLVTQTAGAMRFEQKLDGRQQRFRPAWEKLQDALEARQWREVLATADEVLAVAPRHREAQQARNLAWQAVQPDTAPYHRDAVARITLTGGPPPLADSTASEAANPPEPFSSSSGGLAKRFILWIDGVGAYLVCLASRVTLGQAGPDGGPVDVPLLADVHRIHASLTRDEESYILESTRGMLVNGQPVERVVLQPGDVLTVCASCQMTFDQPVPGCCSARLALTAGRRLPMAVDGVLLMGDMLVLGAGEQAHVRIMDLKQPVYLLRQKDKLGIRWSGEFIVEGQRCKERALLPAQGSVSGEDLAFAIEPLVK
jgi:hypothetical protein